MSKVDQDTYRFCELGTETAEYILCECKALSRQKFQNLGHASLTLEQIKALAPKLVLRKKSLTTPVLLEEIEKLDESDAVPHSIYISPPDDHGFETATDSGDKDCNDPDRLNAKQLLSQAGTNVMCSEDEGEVEPGPKKGDLELGITSQINEEKLPVLTLSASSDPLEIFELFLSPSVVNLLVKYSVMYASTRGSRLELGSEEMYAFIAILFISGYVPVARRRMFWETRDDSHNVLVAKSMRRKRFEEIFKNLHAADYNNLAENVKMGATSTPDCIIGDDHTTTTPMVLPDSSTSTLHNHIFAGKVQ
ncbi:transposase is4 [Holotrichia oblita]|uniref:Transposase is4 n=1 Tax=Holotrichia oblita TaxID=644536 RepID=A0ACB9SGL1_HOLOL|nr:transposase is4 [Holotrichia oblita]